MKDQIVKIKQTPFYFDKKKFKKRIKTSMKPLKKRLNLQQSQKLVLQDKVG